MRKTSSRPFALEKENTCNKKNGVQIRKGGGNSEDRGSNWNSSSDFKACGLKSWAGRPVNWSLWSPARRSGGVPKVQMI